MNGRIRKQYIYFTYEYGEQLQEQESMRFDEKYQVAVKFECFL